jgi:hypothetical protein
MVCRAALGHDPRSVAVRLEALPVLVRVRVRVRVRARGRVGVKVSY